MWHSDKSFLPDIVGGASAEKNDKIIFDFLTNYQPSDVIVHTFIS